MKFLGLLLSILLYSIVSSAQRYTFNEGGTSAQNYYEEISYETINGKMFVYVEIAGRKHKFLFDTGALSTISKELAAGLNTTVINKGVLTDATGATDSASIVSLNNIKLGRLVFKDIPVVVLSPDLYKCWDVDGAVGSNLLRNSIVFIDGAKQLIILTDHLDKLPINTKNGLSLITNTTQQSDPMITLKLKSKVNLILEFDTGDNGFLRMSDDIMNQLSKWGVYDIVARGYGANQVGLLGLQKNADKYLLKIPFLNIGKARFNSVISATNKGGIPGIGTKLLDYGTVTLDFIHRKFYFDAINAVNDLDEKQWPFQPAIIDDKLVVGVVWDKALTQIKPGQQIVAIDDTDCSRIIYCDMVNTKSILAGKETAIITVKDDQGNLKKIQIKKE